MPALDSKVASVASLCAHATTGNASSASATNRALNRGLFFIMVLSLVKAGCILSSVAHKATPVFSLFIVI